VDKNGHQQQPAEADKLSVLTKDQLTLVEDTDLSQEQVAQVLAQRAYELAKLPEDEVKGDLLHLLLFQLSGGQYAIEVMQVREIFPPQLLTPVPRTPDFVVGVFSARGRLISVIDMGIILGLRPTTVAANSKIIVVANQVMEMGFLAEEVEDVTTIFADNLKPALTTHSGEKAHFTRGIADGTTAVLDINAILNDPRLIINEEF
jgi:purine-binding chemotaxis protein CheW